MNITAASLLTVQAYSLNRRAHRARLIAHRRARSIALGPALRLQFEDELTVRYQIQEVLRVDRADDDARRLQDEIDTWSHLVPDGTHWKASLLIELPDAQERARSLPQLSEAAHHVYVQVGRACVTASANEDLHDRHLGRPSGVHFLRFQLPESLRAALLAGAPARIGCAHAAHAVERAMPPALLLQLARDLTLPRKCCDLEPAFGAGLSPMPIC
jgi:hypothetical protein